MQETKNLFGLAAKTVSGIFLILFAACVFNLKICAQPSEGGGAIVAIDEVRAGSGGTIAEPGGKLRAQPIVSQKTKANPKFRRDIVSKTIKKSNNRTKTNQTQTSPTYNGFVIGDKYTFLNFEVARGAKPIHTIAAKNAGAKGLVQVEVLIDENGRVLNAKARTGNRLLYSEAERAALATIFNKPVIYGKPARAIGFLVYRFGQGEE